MVNTELVMSLMGLYSANPENFPMVLSAIVRRETLSLRKTAKEVLDLIEEETLASRGRYLGEHLEDIARAILSLEEFLEYFRDIPLGRDSDGEVTSGETLRLTLSGYRNWLLSIRENVRRDN